MENQDWERRFKKDIADYQKIAGRWQLKETIEERLAAWREEQELASRATIADRFLTPRKPLTEEQLARYIEEISEWLGLESSEVRKWFKK